MKIINTLSNNEILDVDKLTYDEQQYVYNGLDCCITHEVFEHLKPIKDCFAYDMDRTMQAPAFVLSNRGIKIDMEMRGEVLDFLSKEKEKCQKIFDRFCLEGLGVEINYGSWQQLLKLFYEYLQLEPVSVYNKITKEYKPSTSRAALEELAIKQPISKPFIDLIFEMRDIDKKKQVLELGIENDGRMHCNYNVAGTLTGRFSSSEWSFGGGGNLQNITEEMRKAFVPDEGKKFCSIDLDQAESKLVAYLSLPWGDNYLRACNSGDLHTFVAKLIWPELPWPNTPKGDREIAEQPFYRHFSYRDMAKRGGHASNYDGTATIVSMHLKIPIGIAEDFQHKYFKAFPEIKQWHNHVRMQLSTKRYIETPHGRKCFFPGRPWEKDTIKSAIAYGPQSAIADTLNKGFYRVWRKYDPHDIQILLQVHDSILFQYDIERENELVRKVLEDLVVSVPVNGQICRVGASAKVGFNWGNLSDVNPYGLIKFTGQDNRSPPKKSSLLDRRVCSFN